MQYNTRRRNNKRNKKRKFFVFNKNNNNRRPPQIKDYDRLNVAILVEIYNFQNAF